MTARKISKEEYTCLEDGSQNCLSGPFVQSKSSKNETTDHVKLVKQSSKKDKALEDFILGEIVELDKIPLTSLSKSDDQILLQRRPVWIDEDDDAAWPKPNSDSLNTDDTSVKMSKRKRALVTKHNKIPGSLPKWARTALTGTSCTQLTELKNEVFSVDKCAIELGKLRFSRVADANREAPTRQKINFVQFHPSAQVIACGGQNETLSLFQVDGVSNLKLHSLVLERFPIMCGQFTADGTQVLLGSRYRSLQVFDLGRSDVAKYTVSQRAHLVNFARFVVAPDGSCYAVVGTDGYAHLFNTKSHELIGTVKMNSTCNGVQFSPDGKFLLTFGQGPDVYVWDTHSRSCVHRFVDEGCVQMTSIAISSDARRIACGQYSGIVNMYDYSACLRIGVNSPTPVKTFKNLTSPCTSLTFTHDASILAMSSDYNEQCLKLARLTPSPIVFSNFPDPAQKKLSMVVCHDFSLNDGYFAVGTSRGKCFLYRLHDYLSF